MIYVTRTPRPPLDSAVAALWYCESAPRVFALERVLPGLNPQLIVNLKQDEVRGYHRQSGELSSKLAGSVLTGIHTRYEIIDTDEQECVAGVSFKPGGVVAFCRMPASEMLNTDYPLEHAWGAPATAVLREQLLNAKTPEAKLDVLEAALFEHWNPARTERRVGYCLNVFLKAASEQSIASVGLASGLSPKRLIDTFRANVGMTPKKFCRIVRFQQAVARAHQGGFVDWPGLALDLGYYDQAHFIHDFREFSGLTPSGYLSSRTAFQNHVNFLQY